LGKVKASIERKVLLKPIVITAVYTGLRKSDVLGLKWKDIDLERGLYDL
jgi:integrase